MSTATHLTVKLPKLLIFDWHGTLADNSGDLFYGVRETLDILKKNNFILALATSMPQQQIVALLQENQLENYFIIVQTGDMGYQKPDPQMLQTILSFTEQAAQNALMIGDSLADLVMANKANIPSIALLSGCDTQSTLQMAKPIAILETVNALINFLQVN